MVRAETFSALVAVALVLAVVGAGPSQAGDLSFLRGDANFDGRLDIADPVYLLNYAFKGGPRPSCLDSADSNDDGDIDISDAVYVLGFLFTGTEAPREPYPMPGTDPTADSLECEEPIVVLRHGNLVTVAHEVSGKVKHMSNDEIILEDFVYDGGGIPEVVVLLHETRGTELAGTIISEDLRGQQYAGDTLVFQIPPGITGDMFGYVSIWCTSFPLTYGYARLFPGGFPNE